MPESGTIAGRAGNDDDVNCCANTEPAESTIATFQHAYGWQLVLGAMKLTAIVLPEFADILK
jgi:hypothetical protein